MKNSETFLNGWARTDKQRSELGGSIIIRVMHLQC